MVRMVVFDVGETLVDETRHWSEWAQWLKVPEFTFLAVFGAVIASGRHHREVFPLVSRYDYRRAIAERSKSGWRYEIRIDDLYRDALPCLALLRARGFKIGAAGNQPAGCEESLRRMGIELDLMGSSENWGAEKPSRDFFQRLVAESDLRPSEIWYVGDDPENDIRLAQSAGLKTAFIKRGSWALTRSSSVSANSADLQFNALLELS